MPRLVELAEDDTEDEDLGVDATDVALAVPIAVARRSRSCCKRLEVAVEEVCAVDERLVVAVEVVVSPGRDNTPLICIHNQSQTECRRRPSLAQERAHIPSSS